jgi:multimeric flavodoxin WrbA
MKKKVLGLIGSPRKNGNIHLLVSKILEGAEKTGLSTECLMLRDLHIVECDGCHVCWRGKDCSKKDDMNAIYPKLIESDAIVFGTPVYWYGPTALMKGLIDRLVYFNCSENHEKIKGKSAVVAIPFEEENTDTVALLELFFEKCFKYLDLKLVGKVIAPSVMHIGDVLKHTQLLEEAFTIGKK